MRCSYNESGILKKFVKKRRVSGVKNKFSKDTIAETGYFFIGSTNSWNNNGTSDGRGIALDNILVTTCEELASGISIASISMKDSSGNTIDTVGGVDTVKGSYNRCIYR